MFDLITRLIGFLKGKNLSNRIEIHIIAYNEEIMLPFTIAHYRKMFHRPNFYLHDNGSTDNTLNIARKAGMTIVPFVTEGLNDTVQSAIKSNAAKNATSDWVLCIDCDEECMVNDADLKELEERGVNVVEFDGWDIYDKVDSPWDVKVPMGYRSIYYCKPILLKRGEFTEIKFAPGAHSLEFLTPIEGKQTVWSKMEYKLVHYKAWSRVWYEQRSAELGARLSEENIKNNHGHHYKDPGLLAEYDEFFALREKIVDPRIG